MSAARKKKTKKRKKQRPSLHKGPKPVRCTALMVVDSSRIRRKAMGNCKRARTTFEKAERELDAYETRDKPAFVRWYHTELGPHISEAKSLAREIQNLEWKMERMERFADLAGCSRQRAARLYEDSPEEFERRERELLDGLQREEERRRREREDRQEAAERDIRQAFDAFLESQAPWIQRKLRAGALPSDLYVELLADFCGEYGVFPPYALRAFAHPDGYEILTRHGLSDDEDPEEDSDEDFEDFSDLFGRLLGTPEPAVKRESDEARLTALRRELAFALHPDQSDSASDPAKLELWYQVQEAVEHRDLDRLEVLHAHLQMLSGDLSSDTPVSRVQALSAMYRRSRDALRRRIRTLRKEPDWGFGVLDEGGRENIRRQLDALLQEQIEDLRVDLEEACKAYQHHFARSSRRTPPAESAVRERQDDPDQTLFGFL